MFDTQMRGLWGWRGVLGFIGPSVFAFLAEHFYKFGLHGVGMIEVTLGINITSEERVHEAVAEVDKAAKWLVEGGANFVCLRGAPLALVGGRDQNKQLAKRLEQVTNLPSTTELLAAADALHALGVTRLVIVRPGAMAGDDDLRADRHKRFFADNGIEVVNVKHHGMRTTNADRRKLPMNVPYDLAREAYLETPQAEGIYICCGAWGGPPVIQCLEADFGKPVITVYSGSIWAGLKALKIRVPVKGLGRLFETL